MAGLRDEPLCLESLAAGADVVLFSGDKLLGGPQAGIIAGADTLVNVVKRHPLMRALRVDKMTYAALEATLEEYATGRAASEVPVLRMMTLTVGEIEPRAQRVAMALGKSGFNTSVIDGESTIGGGQRAGCVTADTADRARPSRRSPPTISPRGCARSIRRSSRASKTAVSSSTFAPSCRSRMTP